MFSEKAFIPTSPLKPFLSSPHYQIQESIISPLLVQFLNIIWHGWSCPLLKYSSLALWDSTLTWFSSFCSLYGSSSTTLHQSTAKLCLRTQLSTCDLDQLYGFKFHVHTNYFKNVFSPNFSSELQIHKSYCLWNNFTQISNNRFKFNLSQTEILHCPPILPYLCSLAQ